MGLATCMEVNKFHLVRTREVGILMTEGEVESW